MGKKQSTITVRGYAKGSFRPDSLELRIRVDAEGKTTEAASKAAEKASAMLSDALGKAGFGDCLDLLSFDIGEHYEDYEDKNGNYRTRRKGYIATYRLKTVMDADPKDVSNILMVMSSSGADPKIDTYYYIEDQGACVNELLRKAVEDARRKAEVIAEAAGLTLGEIVLIDYSGGVGHTVSHMLAEYECKDASFEPAPADIELSEELAVVWKTESVGKK